MQNIKEIIAQFLTNTYRPKIIDELKSYDRERFKNDLFAGVIVGIVALPLAIAFGIASGVSPEQGIITAIIGGFIVSAMGGSSVQIGGPTGAFIVVVYGIVSSFGTEGLIIATLLAGLMLVLMGVFKLGSIIRFIPYPLIVGFTAGIAVIIFTSQIRDLFGLNIVDMPGDFLSDWMAYGMALSSVNPWSVGVSALSIAIIVLWPKVTKKVPGSLVAIVGVTLIAFLLQRYAGVQGIVTVGDRFSINAELPKPELIPISLQTFRLLLAPAFTIAMLGAIESLLSATVADGVTGQKHDANTELIAQGAANLVVPLFSGIPVTGAIARTMTNINNGGRTPVAGIVHAAVLLIIFLFLGSLTSYIPLATLAAVLVVVAYQMSQWRSIVALLRHPKSDIAVLLTTFGLTVLFDLTIAIEIGMLMAILLFIKRIAETTDISMIKSKHVSDPSEVDLQKNKFVTPDGVEIYQIEGPFFFGIATRFNEVMTNLGNRPKVRIIRMRYVPFIDSTGINNLQSLAELSARQHCTLLLSGVNETVYETMEQSGFISVIGAEHVFSKFEDSLNYATQLVEAKKHEEQH
ncbi:MAG: SulP family inorganic anion transporter [Bradymonadales bacterium]|jgi:SulP family sulfate permease